MCNKYIFVFKILGDIELHIPDGWISLEILGITWFFSIIAMVVSLYKLKDADEVLITRIGIVSAIIIGAQMLNFPLFVGPVTGHLLGGALATILVGPWGAIIAIASVLIVQALVFADGGILALGPNIFNMAIIGVIVTVLVNEIITKYRDDETRIYWTTAIASFLSVPIAATFAVIELFLSGNFGTLDEFITTSFLFAISLHILIGLGEAIISVFIVSYLWKVEFPFESLEKVEAFSR